MNPANENVLICTDRPSLGDLMDAKVRDVFDVREQFPEIEDEVRLVGIGYSSVTRRPYALGRSLAQEVLDASKHYRVVVIL